MNINEYEKKFKKYKKELKDSFSQTLNKMINDLDPSILANEYNQNYTKRIESDPFYKLKFNDMNRNLALEKFNESRLNINKSNGSRYFGKLDLNIGIICDEFLYESFKDVANFEYISREKKEIKDYDFVLFATSWRGVDNSWEGSAHPSNEKREEMI